MVYKLYLDKVVKRKDDLPHTNEIKKWHFIVKRIIKKH